MEEKINIAEILKNKPQGTKLYSPICGAVEFERVFAVYQKKSIVVKELNSNNQHRFWHDGNFFRTGQCVLLPSENMTDWSKFSWKKGDVLQNNDHNIQVIFDRFTSDTYEMIRCKYWLKVDNGNEKFIIETNEFTKNFFKVSEELSQCYINEIEKRLGGKLNIETLEIEKQTEFKDGDIIKMTWDKYSAIVIFWEYSNFGKGLDSHVFFNIKTKIIEYNVHGHTLQDMILRLATEEEKQQLFEALAKEGKTWDAEKKEVVNLKPKVELKPFDKVLVRDSKSDKWRANLLGYIDKDEYYHCVYANWVYCIPYNEETAHLLGTTDEWKGGER